MDKAKVERLHRLKAKALSVGYPLPTREETEEMLALQCEHNTEQAAKNIEHIRAKAKARLLVKLVVASASSADMLTMDLWREVAASTVDAMTDEEVSLVDW